MSTVWSDVVGQERAVQRLVDLANNRVHAYLFVGPEGCGKESAARAFAARLITGADDADIGWRVVEHHVATPTERTVAEVFRDNPRQAIDAAIQAVSGIKVKHGREAQQICRVDCGECANVTSG